MSQALTDALVSIREKDVEHIERSLARTGERLVVEPAVCQECGFGFEKREALPVARA